MDQCISKYIILDGELRKTEECKDIFGEKGLSLYEVIRVIQGVPLFLEEHLKRLENSAKLTGTKIKYDMISIKQFLNDLIEKNEILEGNIKIIFNHDAEEKFYAYFIKSSYPTEDLYLKGVATIFYHGERVNPNAKVINNGFRALVNKEISEANVYEAILVDNQGNITEGSKSNIFLIKADTVYTAPLKDVLPGVTRERIIKMLQLLNIKFEEKSINFKEVSDMDALFITGTSPKVLPIKSVNDEEFDFSDNTTLIKIITEYNNLINKYIVNAKKGKN